VVGPFLLLLMAWLAPLLTIILVMWPIHAMHPLLPPPAWVPPVGDGLMNLVRFGGPLVIGCGVALLGARQRSRAMWPLLGCAVVALFGDSLYPVTNWPTTTSHGLGLGIGIRGLDRLNHHYRFSLIDWSQSLPLVALSLAVAAAVYWMARREPLATV
jgi:hypothetical protein